MSYDRKDILYSFKVVICGASAVGKSSLFNRFCFNSFNFDTSPTIGINFHSVYLEINFEKSPDELKENFIILFIFDVFLILYTISCLIGSKAEIILE